MKLIQGKTKQSYLLLGAALTVCFLVAAEAVQAFGVHVYHHYGGGYGGGYHRGYGGYHRGYGGYHRGYGYHRHHSIFGFLFGIIIVLVVLAVLAVVLLSRRNKRGSRNDFED